METTHPQSMTIENAEQLEQYLAQYLAHLLDRGAEHVGYWDAQGNPGFLYPIGEYDVTWHAVESNPYDHEHDRDGVKFLHDDDPALHDADPDHRYIRIDLDKLEQPPVFAHYPLTLVHRSLFSWQAAS